MKQSTLMQKIILWGVYLVLFMTPIVFLPFVYRQFDIGKSVPFKMIIALLTMIFCVWQIYKPQQELFSKKIRSFFPFIIPTFFLVLNYLFSTFMSDDIWMSVVGLYERQIGMSGFFACIVIGLFIVLFSTKEYGHEFGLKIFKIMTFILGAAAVIQYLKIYDFMLRDPPAGRSNALLGNANFLGDQIVFFTPLFLSSYFLAKDKFGKVLNLLFFTVCSLGIFTTGTRGAYLALGVSALAFLFLLLVVNDSIEKRKVNNIILHLLFGVLTFLLASLFASQWGNWILILCLIPILGFLVWSYFRLSFKTAGKSWQQATPWLLALILTCSLIAGGGARLRYENSAIDRYYSLFDLSGKATPRFLIWRDGMTFIRDIPVWGVGPEMFREKFMSYKSKDTEELEPHTHYDNPHNNYLYILFSLGPVGLILHLWILARFFRMNYSLISDNKLSRTIRMTAVGFFTVMVSYAVWTIPGFEFLSSIASFWGFIGIFCIFYSSVKAEETIWEFRILKFLKKLTYVFEKKFVSTGVYFILFSLSVWLLIDNYKIYVADTHFVDGLINRGRGQFRSSIDDFEEALGYNPRESYYYLHIGKSYADLIRRETDFEMKTRYAAHAEEALLRGLDHAWSPDLIYATKANVRLGLGDKQGAIDAMTQVLQVYPATIEYRKFLNYIINDLGK